MLEVTALPKEEIKYPVARREPDYGFIVLFFSESHGVVISANDNDVYNIGDMSLNWPSCNNSEDWEPVNITITG